MNANRFYSAFTWYKKIFCTLCTASRFSPHLFWVTSHSTNITQAIHLHEFEYGLFFFQFGNHVRTVWTRIYSIDLNIVSRNNVSTISEQFLDFFLFKNKFFLKKLLNKSNVWVWVNFVRNTIQSFHEFHKVFSSFIQEKVSNLIFQFGFRFNVIA